MDEPEQDNRRIGAAVIPLVIVTVLAVLRIVGLVVL